MIAASAGPGASCSPARRIDSCQTPVMNSTLESSIAPNAAENRIAATLAIANERTRSIAGSTTGEGWRAQRRANSARPAAAPASAASVRGSSQPHSGACTKPSASAPTDAASSAVPSQSGRPCSVEVARLGQQPRRAPQRPRADGQVDEEHEPPVDLHEQAAERRPGRGGRGADAGPDADRGRALARLELGQQQRQRGRHEQRRARGLQHAGGHQRRHRRRDPAQRRADREQHEPGLGSRACGRCGRRAGPAGTSSAANTIA